MKALGAAVFFLAIALVSITEPHWMQKGLLVDPSKLLLPPSSQNILGTDSLGRDFLSRLVKGTNTSLVIGVMGSFLGVSLGLLAGIVAAESKLVGRIFLNILDHLAALPDVFLLLAFSLLFSRLNPVFGTILALNILNLYPVVRTTMSEALRLKNIEYVVSARALGAKPIRVYFVHVFPQLAQIAFTVFLTQIPVNILYESTLSFLGLGLQVPHVSWGLLANEGWKYLEMRPLLCLAPCLCIFFVTLSISEIIEAITKTFSPTRPSYISINNL